MRNDRRTDRRRHVKPVVAFRNLRRLSGPDLSYTVFLILNHFVIDKKLLIHPKYGKNIPN